MPTEKVEPNEDTPDTGVKRGATTAAPPQRTSQNGVAAAPTQSDEPAPPPGPDAAKTGMPSGRKLLLAAVAALLLALGAVFGLRAYNFNKTHVSTDDAYVTGNLVNVSPVISGTLARLTVEEGDIVRKGQLIARMDDGGPRAAVRQAEAAYQAALSQVPQARISLAYQRQATQAAIRRAQAGLAAQGARTRGAQAQVTLTSSTVGGQVRQARSQVLAAQAQAAQVASQIRSARAGVANARQGVQTAERAANATSARIQAAEAEVTRTSRDEARYARLLAQEAVTQQQYDAVVAQRASAQSQLTSAREQAAQARSQVAQARVAVVQAEGVLSAAGRASETAREQVGVARSGLALAQTGSGQLPVQASNAAFNVEQGAQAEADLENALAGRTQIALRERQIATVRAQAGQAAAVLANARIQLADTLLYAPADGTIVRKTTNVGASLSPGQTIVTMTQGDSVYVTANFKETQLGRVHAGQPVELEVDAFPGRVFLGHVQSINEATGATTSLLPPDNATGNFTKVVQRIAVRIVFVPAGASADKKYARQADIRSLRQGMSVTATINLSENNER